MVKKLNAAGGYTLGGSKMTGVADGTGSSDAVNRAQLDALPTDIYPLSGYGLVAASGDPMNFMGVSPASSDSIAGQRVWIPAGAVITSLWGTVRNEATYATSSTPNQIGLYTDAGVLVSATVNSNTLWTSPGWRGANLPSPIAAQSAGRFVYIVTIYGGVSGLYIAAMNAADDAHGAWFCFPATGTAKRRGFYDGGVTALPSSFDPTSYGTTSSYITLVGAG